MVQTNLSQIKRAISTLKCQNRRLTRSFRILLVLGIATLLAFALIKNTDAEPALTPDAVLRIRRLIVVDQNGHERVHGAPLLEVRCSHLEGHSESVTEAVFLPHANAVASSSLDVTIRIWSLV